MTKVLTRSEVRALDERAIHEFGIPGIILMENAGRGAAELLMSLGINGPVSIWCGRGNNGGDGFVLARHLDAAGHAATVRFFADPASLEGDAAIAYRMIASADIPINITKTDGDLPWEAMREELAQADWVVDGLFGTGFVGPLREPWPKIIQLMNDQTKRIFALDIPSGLDADTGLPAPVAIRAMHVATFAALKPCFLRPDAQPYIGQVTVVPIGVPRKLLDDAPACE